MEGYFKVKFDFTSFIRPLIYVSHTPSVVHAPFTPDIAGFSVADNILGAFCKDCLPGSVQLLLSTIGSHSRPWDKDLLQGKYC